jgi:hypothetical protein
MIKAVGEVRDAAGTRPALFLCPDRVNIDRLMAGDPIVFETAPMRLPSMRVILMYGADPDAIRARMAPMMRPGMTAHLDIAGDQAVNWRGVAERLAAAIELAAVPADGPAPPVLADALARFRAAVQREGR